MNYSNDIANIPLLLWQEPDRMCVSEMKLSEHYAARKNN